MSADGQAKTPAPVVETVPFSKLVMVDEINARGKSKEGIDELAASIAADGIIQPLAVRRAPDSRIFQIIDGDRRFLAM